jgi:hypothetical protein
MKLNCGLLFFFVVMVVCISPVYAIQQDGILKYDMADSGKVTNTYGMNPWGHAVFFKNKDTITVTGIQLYGCQFGTGTKKVTVEIWDKDLKMLYQDKIPYSQISMSLMDVSQNNCADVASWAEVPLPNHVVTGDFYMVVFTNSPKPSLTSQGMSLGYTMTSITGTSHTVLSNPNRIDDISLAGKYSQLAIDWIIRVYYTNPPKTTMSTPVPSLTQQNVQASTTTIPLVTSPTLDQISATPPVKIESTKANINVSLVVIGVIISILLWKRPY